MALIPLNTFKTKTAVLSTLKYNQAKCARDTALIVDSIAYDLLFGGSTQTEFAAVQYWSQGVSKIDGEVFQTISALQHAKEVALQLILNIPVDASVGNLISQNMSYPESDLESQLLIENEFNLIIDIIENGTAGVTDRIITNGAHIDTNSSMANAVAILQANKTFLQHEIVAFVNSRFGKGYVYDKAKCSRDTGLIVDSIAFDLLFNGSTQSLFAGLQYWSQGSTKINGEINQTSAAVDFAKSLMKKIVVNEVIINTTGNKLSQIINTSIPGNLTSKNKVDTLMSKISDIIVNGTTGVTDDIQPNGMATSDTGLLNAYTLLQANKKYIQSEVIAWINYNVASNTPPFSYSFAYDSDKCYRDIGYIVDSISFDLKYGGNRQTIQAGVYYYGFSTDVSLIETEMAEALSAYKYLETLVNDVILGQPIATIYQRDVLQNISLTSGSSYEADIASENVKLIRNIIKYGPNGAYASPWSNSVAYQPDDAVVYNGVVYISNTINTNKNPTLNLSDWNMDELGFTSELHPIGLKETTDYNLISAAKILLANKEFIQAQIVAYIDAITHYTVISSTEMQTGRTYTIVTVGDSDFGAAGAPVGFVSGTTFVATGSVVGSGTVSVGFTYPNSSLYTNDNLCFRDIGYIVDCINFDLTYPGNRQAAQAGVYYYSNSADTSVVPTEKTDTIDAYNYMGIVMSAIVTNTFLTQGAITSYKNKNKYLKAPYQQEIKQDMSYYIPTAGDPRKCDEIAWSIYNIDRSHPFGLIDTLVNIINNGPGSANVREPIASTPVSDEAYQTAFDLIMLNKEFIVSEVIGYMNNLKSPNTTKIYTAPPGVTSIVLMAQVANVTDHDISLTFAHYRNIPVFPDPATLNGYQAGDTVTEIVKDYIIPPNDSASLLSGKMIIESFDSIVAFASESSGLKVTLSILETANA
jgi:hypothetical protein